MPVPAEPEIPQVVLADLLIGQVLTAIDGQHGESLDGKLGRGDAPSGSDADDDGVVAVPKLVDPACGQRGGALRRQAARPP